MVFGGFVSCLGYPRPPVFDGAGVPWVLTVKMPSGVAFDAKIHKRLCLLESQLIHNDVKRVSYLYR